MDAMTAAIAVSIFALFSFFAILLSSLNNLETFKENKYIVLSSFLLFISLMSLVFDLRSMQTNTHHWWSAFLFGASFYASISILVGLIRILYDQDKSIKKTLLIVTTLISGTWFIAPIVYENYIIRSISIGLLITVPFVYLVFIFAYKKVLFYKSVFFYLIGIMVLLYTFKSILLITGIDQSDFNSFTDITILFTLIPFVILISTFLAYLLEKERLQKIELKKNELRLNLTLDKIKSISETDLVTKHANRYKLTIELEKHFYQYINHQKCFSIMMLDVNNFKAVNDNYGHNKGDQVLKYIADEITSILPINHVFGRWGGDEFLIIISESTIDHCSRYKEKIHQHFSHQLCPYINDHLNLSIGYSTIESKTDINELLHEADQHMYLDKNKSAIAI